MASSLDRYLKAQMRMPNPEDPLGYLDVGTQETPNLTPEEESSLLGNVMSGVQWLGETLDKPGAAVRGLIGGALGAEGPQAGLGALVNLVPFSDTLHWTNPEERIGGRELLERAGIAPENRPGLNIFDEAGNFDLTDVAGDVGGFAVDVATDPLTWLTGPLGTFTKSGRAALKGAEKVGTTSADMMRAAKQLASKEPLVGQVMSTTPAAVAEQFRAGMRAPLGFHVPFTDVYADLPVPEAVNNAMAWALDKATYGKYSPVPKIRGALSHTVGGVYKSAVQRERDLRWAEKEAMQNRLLDAAPAFRARSDDLQETFRQIAEHHGKIGDAKAYQAFEREMLENADALPDPAGIVEGMRRYWNAQGGTQINRLGAEADDAAVKFHEFYDTLHKTVKEAGDRYISLGGDLRRLNDKYVEYFPRRLSGVLQRMMEARAKAKGKGTGPDIMQFWRARKDYLRDYPGRSTGLNRIATDSAFMGYKEVDGKLVRMTAEEQRQAIIDAARATRTQITHKNSLHEFRKEWLLERYIKPDLDNALASGRITQEEYAKEFRRFTDSTAPENAVRKGKATDAADRLINTFSKLPGEVVHSGIFDRAAIDDWFSYMRAMAETESTLRTAHSLLAQPQVVSAVGKGESLVRAWQDAGFKREGLHTFLAENTGDGKLFASGSYDPKKAGEFIKTLTIDPKAGKVLRAFGELTRPDKLNEIGSFIDKVNATYKGWLTVAFPSFHARNLASGYWQNLADGHLGVSELTGAYRDAIYFARGDQSRLKFVQEFLDAGGLQGHGQMVDIAGSAAKNAVPTGGFLGIFAPLKEAVKSPKWSDINPFTMRGGFGLKAEEGAQNVLMQMGDKAYNWVEFLNRAAPYEALRRKGMTPAQALYRVNRAQFDYSKLAPLEKTYLRRAVPFYTWIRKSLPYSLQRLFERPGGLVAQSIRAESQPSAKDQYTPAFLREGMNIPWGGGTPEATTYLRQAGLPIEDFNRFIFSGGLPNLQRTGERIGAQLHPLLTLPIEMASGKQLYSGRKIENLESPTEALFGRLRKWGVPIDEGTKLPSIDKAIHYSPASRTVGEGMSFFDPRKNWLQSILNATTGVKSGTYDIEKQRLIDLRNAEVEALKENPLIEDTTEYFVPPGKRGEPGADIAQVKAAQLRRLRKALKKVYEERESRKQTVR